LPEIPTLSESVPGYEASLWFGIVAPKNTPVAIVEKLNAEINAGLADPRIRARFTGLGGSVLVGTSASFRQFIVEETEKWAKVVRSSGMKAV
jgi:tripartite-type tricarboxylate transporter receptor subunit TctC